MRASLSLLGNLFFALILFGSFFVGMADSGSQGADAGHKVTKGLSDKVKSTPSSEKVRVIIRLKKPEGRFKAQSARNSVRDDVVKGGGKVKAEYSLFEGMAAEVPASRVAALAKNPNVELIVEDREMRASLTESVPLINADDVWNKIHAGSNITGKGQTVCVIDSGVDYNHPDLGGGKGDGFKVLGGYDFVNGDNDPVDDYGHGTHMAGIIAANGTLKGVAPDANIIAIKSLDASGSGYDSWILSGIDWCVSNASVYNITVISMSLGGYSYTSYCDNEVNETPFRELIDAAVANNIMVVVSTGNDANYTAITSPACIQNATRVGAAYDGDIGLQGWSSCTDHTTSADKITCFTNRGPNFPDLLLAPGAEINSTYLSDGYSEIGGTSMAAPHVSGLIVLLNQEYKGIYGTNPSPSYLFDVMNSTGVSIYDSQTGKNYSRIDALAAYNAIYPFSSIYSDDLDDDGDEWDNNFTASYNTSSNTPFWSGSLNKINLTDANTGEGKLIIINDTGLLFDGNSDGDLKDVNSGDYILFNGIYIIDGASGTVQPTYNLYEHSIYSNGDGNINAGEVVLIKGSEYVVIDNETSDQNITLGQAIAKTLDATAVNESNATLISGAKKILYGSDEALRFYNASSIVDNVSLFGISEYPYKLNPSQITSDAFKIYSIYVISSNATTAKVTFVNWSQVANFSNDEIDVLGYNSIKIDDAGFPMTGEIILLSDVIGLIKYQYVDIPDTYYSIYFDGDKNLYILRRNTTAPTITSGPNSSSITTSAAVITWTTSSESNSTVEYGTNTSYGSTKGDSSLVTSHSVSLTGLSSSTTYHYRVMSADIVGNTNTSGDYNFTTSTPVTYSSGGGGGGSASPKITVSASESKVEITISYLPANKKTTVTIPSTENMPFASLGINVNKKVSNVEMTIKTLDAKPSDISTDISGNVKDYVQIDTKNILDSDIDSVSHGFKVPLSWIDDNGIDKEQIVLSRYADDKWNSLAAAKTSEDSDYVYYSAVSPGLSVFGISGKKQQKEVSLPRISAHAKTAAPATTAPPAAPVTTAPPEGPPVGMIVFAILTIVMIATAAYYLYQRKGEKRDGEEEPKE